MYYAKNLVFISVYLGILLSGQKSFRGLEKDHVLQTQVPLSFMHHIASNYDVVPQQLNPVRGSYLIIARDGLVQEGYIDYFSDFKKSGISFGPVFFFAKKPFICFVNLEFLIFLLETLGSIAAAN